jgi:aminobenzoyl-glutamate transport protein
MKDAAAPRKRPTLLDRIERVANAMPDPMTLFVIGTVLVFVASWFVARSGHVSLLAIEGHPAPPTAQAWNLLSTDGFRWLLENLISIFVNFRPLGLVLVAAIGIAIAEKSGLIAAGLKMILLVVPASLLTPATFFAGVMSSMAVDAGYIVLPPLAAAIYRAVGRSPLVGLAAVFAGVASGFNANLFITGIDPLVAGLTEEGARLLDPSKVVNPACNWWFMIASTFLVTFVGWGVTKWIVEPRLSKRSAEEGGPGQVEGGPTMDLALAPIEKRGLVVAFAAGLATLGFLVLMYYAPWGFLHDAVPKPMATWISNIVPLLLLLFLVPGLAYGIAVKTIRSDRDVVRMMSEYMALLGNYIVLAFFAAIFVKAFEQSRLGTMLAIEGGNALRSAGLSPTMLMVGFVLLIAFLNLFIGSMSAKWAMLASMFVPMFMAVGISPELTQVAYRIGDSVTNSITPLNTYLVIVLAFMQQYAKKSGMGSLIALMLPYSIALTIAWILMLVGWIALDLPLGPKGPLHYVLPR